MRESFLQLVKGERPSEVVWCADITYWIDGHVANGSASPRLQTEIGLLELCKELGMMPYYWYGKFDAAEPRYDPGIEVVTTTQGRRTIKTWRTPVGSIAAEGERLEGTMTEAPIRYPVQDERELDVWLYLLEHRRLEPTLEGFTNRVELWAQYDGIPGLGLPRSPLPACCRAP